MHAYIHTFIANSEASLLSPLHATEPIHVRLFFSPHNQSISKENYQQYLQWLGCEDQLTEFHVLGKVPPTVTKESLLPSNPRTTQVNKITYDFVLEALEDYHDYLEFVKQTLLIEEKRPVFRPQQKTSEPVNDVQEVNEFGLEFTIKTKCIVVKDRDEIPLTPEYASFLLIHPPSPSKSHTIYTLWKSMRDECYKYAKFYCKEDTSVSHPQIMTFCNECWIECSTMKDVEEYITMKRISLHKLSTGHLIQDLQGQNWEKVLGTEAMPQVRIQMSLSLQGLYLSKKQNGEVVEKQLNPAQYAMIRKFFQDVELQPFSISALFDVFLTESAANAYAATVATVATAATSAVASLRKVPAASNAGAEQVVPSGKDVYACCWETVKSLPKKTPDANKVKEQLLQLLHAFKTSHAPLQNPPLQTVSPTLFQHGFLLYLLNMQQQDRNNTDMDYQSIIDYYKQSKMNLQGTEFTAAHLTLLYPLLAPNTEFIEKAEAPNGFSILEARVLLSLFMFPLEYRNAEHQIILFQMVVKEFAKELKRTEEGRVGAKVVWDEFLTFLRKRKADYVGFFGSQQEFNDVLRDLGWEQKRLAQGKVWMKMELSTPF